MEEGRRDEAFALWQELVACDAADTEALTAIGSLLRSSGRPHEALVPLREVTRLIPHDSCGWYNLGLAWYDMGRNDAARICLDRCLHCNPQYADALFAQGRVLMNLGMLQQAHACLETLCKSHPNNERYRSSHLFCSLHMPDWPPERLVALHRRWGDDFGHPDGQATCWDNEPDPDKILRIGYVSGDWYHHPVGWFLEPVLRAHDPETVEIYCYSDVVLADEYTERFRTLAHRWNDCSAMSLCDSAAQVRRDRIDILVDCAGHTARRMLGLFALRPAPLQMSWLGYPATTGMQAMDYRIGDAVTDPRGAEQWYVERIERPGGAFFPLPRPWEQVCVSPPPFEKNGYVTFGSTHRLLRLNDEVLAAWGGVLNRCPGSRLLVFRDTLTEMSVTFLRERMLHQGLDTERVVFSSDPAEPDNLLSVYTRIDVALDTFPWSGHTMACEALWCGVPVVTLKGALHAGRMVASLLAGCGLQELCTRTIPDYVGCAAALAASPARIRELRRTLPGRLERSPLFDHAACTRSLEQVYRRVWKRYCEGTHAAC